MASNAVSKKSYGEDAPGRIRLRGSDARREDRSGTEGRILSDSRPDAVLGTAHISPAESLIVVEAARDAGVKNIVITHPEWWIVGMTMEEQKRLVEDYDVILERCFAQNMGGGKYKSNLPDNLETIREIGYEHVMVDTDGGQTENPNWEIAIAEYMQYLIDHGVPEEQVYYMTKTIPSRLLDWKHRTKEDKNYDECSNRGIHCHRGYSWL